jgi:hypothetical protein
MNRVYTVFLSTARMGGIDLLSKRSISYSVDTTSRIDILMLFMS